MMFALVTRDGETPSPGRSSETLRRQSWRFRVFPPMPLSTTPCPYLHLVDSSNLAHPRVLLHNFKLLSGNWWTTLGIPKDGIQSRGASTLAGTSSIQLRHPIPPEHSPSQQ